MKEIDGSYLEGGGQIIRTALALSTVTGIPFKAKNIRKGRQKPGLKTQHMSCINALKQLCNAKVKGEKIGSCELEYIPREIKTRNIEIDIGTAGSITLLMQSLLLPVMFNRRGTKIKIIGGTCGLYQMPIEYFQEVFTPHIKKYVKKIEVILLKRGYYPKGQGIVEIVIEPKYKLKDFSDTEEFIRFIKQDSIKINLLKQGKLHQIKGISHASKSLESKKVAERQARSARLALLNTRCPVRIRQEYQDTASTGTGITLYSIHSLDKNEIDFKNPIRLGSDTIGKKGKPSKKVGEECAKELIKAINSKAPVDKHLADNLIPLLALFGGEIKVQEITNHTRTNIWICEQFLGKIFEVDEEKKTIKVI